MCVCVLLNIYNMLDFIFITYTIIISTILVVVWLMSHDLLWDKMK